MPNMIEFLVQIITPMLILSQFIIILITITFVYLISLLYFEIFGL